jgi:hypothetical protein
VNRLEAHARKVVIALMGRGTLFAKVVFHLLEEAVLRVYQNDEGQWVAQGFQDPHLTPEGATKVILTHYTDDKVTLHLYADLHRERERRLQRRGMWQVIQMTPPFTQWVTDPADALGNSVGDISGNRKKLKIVALARNRGDHTTYVHRDSPDTLEWKVTIDPPHPSHITTTTYEKFAHAVAYADALKLPGDP